MAELRSTELEEDLEGLEIDFLRILGLCVDEHMAELKGSELEGDLDIQRRSKENAEYQPLYYEIPWETLSGFFLEDMSELKGSELEGDLDIQRRSKENAEYQPLYYEIPWETLSGFFLEDVQRCCPLAEQITHVHVSPHVMTVLKKLKDLGETSVGVRISIIDDDKVILNGIDEALLSKKMMSLLDTCINASVGKRYKLEKGIMRLLREQKFVDHVSKILEEKGANVAWKANSGNWNSITIYGMTKADVDLWLKVMKEELVCYEIQLNDRMVKTLKQRSWFEARKEFESNPLLVLEKKGTMMKLYGTRDEAEIAQRKIEELLCANSIGIKICLQLPSALSLPFGSLSNACGGIVESFRDDSLKIECDETNGSFVIFGPKQFVPEIEKKIKDLVDNMVLEEVYVKQLGISGQLLSAVRMKLENTHLTHGVYIEHLVENSESRQEILQQNGSVSKQSAQLAGSRNDQPLSSSENEVTLKLNLGEIVECRMDAIVNIVGECLKQDEGMSGNICHTAYKNPERSRFLISVVENSQPFQSLAPGVPADDYFLAGTAMKSAYLKIPGVMSIPINQHQNQLNFLKMLNVLKKSIVFAGETSSTVTCVKGRIFAAREDMNLLKKKKENLVSETFEMDEGVIKMLGESKFIDHIEKCVIDKCVDIVWEMHDWNKITIYGATEKDIDCANKIIKEELQCFKVVLTEDKCTALKNPLWLDLKQAVQKHPLLMLEETGLVIKIYGVHELAEKFKGEVEKFLNDYKIERISIPILPGFGKHMSMLMSTEFQTLVESSQSSTNHIPLKAGCSKNYTSSDYYIQNEKNGTFGSLVKEVTLTGLGMSEHFRSVAGRDKFENILLSHGVYIENITEGLKEKAHGNENDSPGLKEVAVLSANKNVVFSERELENGLNVKIVMGDIATCEVDAIVNVINEQNMEVTESVFTSEIGYQIMHVDFAAHCAVQLERPQISKLPQPRPQIVPEKIFTHIFPPDWCNAECFKHLNGLVTDTLNRAEECRCASVALPVTGLVSCDNIHVLGEVCATIQEAIVSWGDATGNCHVKEIWIVDQNLEAIHTFHSFMEDNDAFKEKGTWNVSETTSAMKDGDTKIQKCLSFDTPVKLRLVGVNDHQIRRAVEDLEQYCYEVIQTFVIDDKESARAIVTLTDEQVGQINILEKEFCVHIDVNRDQGKIMIEGEEEFLIEVKYQILNLLRNK